MHTCGIFTTHQFKIPVDGWGKKFRIVIFGDVHRDSPNHAGGHWKRFLKHCQGLDDAYYLGMGDYVEQLSSSERQTIRAGKLHESFKKNIQSAGRDAVARLADELSFAKGRVIGLIGGNHFMEFSSGETSDNLLCRALDTTFLGVSSFVRLQIWVNGSRAMSFDIWAHHGKGAARLIGGSINRVDQMREIAEADLYAMGHDHKRCIVPAQPRLFLENTSRAGLLVRERETWLARSGSFLASYEPGVANYNVDEARGPCSLGHVELELTPRRQEFKDKPAKTWLEGRGIN